jgi:lipid-A-disaccharide synthase-like uncharacterized protein
VTAAEIAIKAAGWAGQACFFSRFLIQWIASERVKRSIVPAVFWRFSLLGSVLAGLYAWLGPPHDIVFGATYAFNLVVYGRNLILASRPEARLRPVPLAIAAFGVAAGTAFALSRDPKVRAVLDQESTVWLTVGIAGQLIFGCRFFLQWIYAERRGRADLPAFFFVVSLVGSLPLLAYAIHKRDEILIAGNALVPLISIRNLVLHRRTHAAGTAQAGPAAPSAPPR